MKSSIVFGFSLVVFIACFISGCKKDKCPAGTGGDVTLVASPKHHSTHIPSLASHPDTVYLKFDTQDSPGTDLASYDKFFVGEVGEDHVHLEGLKCGDYYIYAVGFDSTINERVTGGIPFSFSQESGEIHVSIPVSEHH